MKAIWMKKGIMTLMAAAVTMSPERVTSEPDHWEYEVSQDFTVASDGIYQFELYGAQGGSYQEHTGGKGGMVNMQVSLQQNDRVELRIGGSDGSQGGGQGTLTFGGGATTVVINGVTVAVAGGGGGATDILNGESGGCGFSGISTGNGESSSEPNSAGGGGGHQGGQSGYTRYHEHTGSEESGGGCYTGEIRHTHDGSCFVQCGTFENFRVSDDQPGYIEANCSVCGEWGSNEGDMDSDFITDGSWTHTKRDCGKDNGAIEGYRLVCGKSKDVIEENKQAYGGTNYYNAEMCRNVSTAAGVRLGNGKIVITQCPQEQLTLNYYNYDMTLLGSVTTSKGSTAAYPVKIEPIRKEDSQYSYNFTGWDDMETGRKENLTGADTVQSPVTENKNYIAVYRNIPREYTVTLEDAYGNVVETITAVYGKQMPDITLPVREDELFAGYYRQKDGRETCYYSTSGEPTRKSDIVQNETFYAYWVKPVSITKQPVSVEVESDYKESYMEITYEQSTKQGYTITPQWYMQQNGKKTKVENGNTIKYKIPSGYKAGKYTFWCELTVSCEQNGQQITVSSNQATLQVNQAAEPPKKEDTRPTTPDQDKDNTTGKPGDSNNGSTTGKPGDSNNGSTTNPDDTSNGSATPPDNSNNGSTTNPGDSNNGNTTKPGDSSSGSTTNPDNSSNETTNKPDNTDNGISGKNNNSTNVVAGKNDITNINDATFILADSLNPSQLPADGNKQENTEIVTPALTIAPDSTALTTIFDDTPWESHTSIDDAPWINHTGTDDNMDHDHDAVSPQNPTTYETELVKANYSFVVGLSILGLIGIMLLILFLRNNHEDHCAEE